MTVFGYARVSTRDQSLDVQLDALKGAGATVIYSEQITGKTVLGREELERCLSGLGRGDILVVTKVDRIARSLRDLSNIVADLTERGVEFKCVDQPGMDTTTPMGKFMMNILGAVAEFEVEMIASRRREGIRKAQLAGKYVRPQDQANMALARQLRRDEGLTAAQIASRVGVSVRTVYRMTRGMWGETLKVVA